jgi:hypothetical protein
MRKPRKKSSERVLRGVTQASCLIRLAGFPACHAHDAQAGMLA